MSISKKVYAIVLFFSLFGCVKNDGNAIFIQNYNKNHSKYNFIIDGHLIFPINRDSTIYTLKKDTLYLKYDNETVKYQKLNLKNIDKINYDTIHVSFKNVIDSPFKFDYDMNIYSDGQVLIKVYQYEGNKKLTLKMSKPFEDWVNYALQDFDKYNKFYGKKSAGDKSEMLIILKKEDENKLIYGDLNELPSKLQLLAFIFEIYIRQSFKSENSIKKISHFPSSDSLEFYAQKTGIGKGRVPPPLPKKW
ncbi:hypothetical protein PG593_08540 [Riemerella anatipestifer]|nr:hypothetical protein [Riemerella anatipestifer]